MQSDLPDHSLTGGDETKPHLPIYDKIFMSPIKTQFLLSCNTHSPQIKTHYVAYAISRWHCLLLFLLTNTKKEKENRQQNVLTWKLHFFFSAFNELNRKLFCLGWRSTSESSLTVSPATASERSFCTATLTDQAGGGGRVQRGGAFGL